MKMYSENADALAASMASLLEEAGMLEKQASDEEVSTELDALAGSLLTVADQLDQAGMEEAAARVDQAVADVAEYLPKCPDCPASEGEFAVEPRVIAQASATTLIRLADRFDAMDHEKIVRSIDGALAVLAGKKKDKDEGEDEKKEKSKKAKCECDCKKCKANKHCAKCDCEPESKKKLNKEAAATDAQIKSLLDGLKGLEGRLSKYSNQAQDVWKRVLWQEALYLGKLIRSVDQSHLGENVPEL